MATKKPAKKATADQLLEKLYEMAGVAEELDQAARMEAREDIAASFLKMAKGTRAADAELRQCYQYHCDGGDLGDEIPQGFREGMIFAAKLLADEDYDY